MSTVSSAGKKKKKKRRSRAHDVRAIQLEDYTLRLTIDVIGVVSLWVQTILNGNKLLLIRA